MKKIRNIILKKIPPTTKKKKAHKKTTGEPDKDKDHAPVDTENTDMPEEDDMSPLDHQFNYWKHWLKF